MKHLQWQQDLLSFQHNITLACKVIKKVKERLHFLGHGKPQFQIHYIMKNVTILESKTSKMNKGQFLSVFESNRKSLNRLCERSEPRLHFGWSNSVTRWASFIRTKIGEKYQKLKHQMRHFE